MNRYGVLRWAVVCFVVLAGLSSAACGSSSAEGSSDAGSTESGARDATQGDAQAPPPAEGGAACQFAYQCATGTYCNLQQCMQECNTQKACGNGQVCTPRGECAASASAPSDPTPAVQSGQLAASTNLVVVSSTDTSFSLGLTGSRNVSYRLASSASWVVPPSQLGTFNGSTTLEFKVKPSLAPASALTASVTIYSEQGDVTVYVSAQPPLQGVWQGAVTFTSVNLPADGGSVPLPMGQAQLALDIRTGAPGLRAQVDPSSSTLWAAPAAGPAAGTGTMSADGRVTFTLAEVADSQSVQSLYGPSVLQTAAGTARPIGRQLALTLTENADGSLSGTTAERIYGLTSTPVEIDGTVTFHLNANATVPTFGAPAAVTMPGGPPAIALDSPFAPDGGLTASECETGLTDAGVAACAGGTSADKWSCITGNGAPNSGVLQNGFPIDTFYSPNPQAAFTITSTPDGGTGNAYQSAAAQCAAGLPASFRPLTPVGRPADPGCANTGAIDCARYMALTKLAGNPSSPGNNPDLAAQGVMDVARAYGELFELIGNQDAVTALGDRLTPSIATTQYRGDVLSGRQAYDAALYFILTPDLFEALRSVSASDAQSGPLSRPNNEVALARAAESLTRSATQTMTALQIDLSTSTNVMTLHSQAQADATLYFVEAALLADLDARWRGGLSAPIQQVTQFAPMLSAYDQAIQGILPDYTPLGVPTEYVPLLAQSPTGPQTNNFLSLNTTAASSVMTSVSADTTALNTTRTFDLEQAAATAAVTADQANQIATIVAICGESFVTNNQPNPDITQCGANGGTLQTAGLAVQSAGYQVQQAQQSLQAAYQNYADQQAAYLEDNNLAGEELSFVNASNQTIFNLSKAQAGVQAAADIATAIGSGLESLGKPPTPWSCVGLGFTITGGALSAAATLIGPYITQQQELQQSEALQIGDEMTAIQEALSLQQTALTFAGLATQVAIASNQFASALSSASTLGQQVQAAEAALTSDNLTLANEAFASDPSFRIIEAWGAETAGQARAAAKLDLYYAARGLEYETNTQMPSILTAINAATSGNTLSSIEACLTDTVWPDWQMLVSSANSYVTEVSLAEDILGITGSVTDPTTGQTLSAGEQFRHFIFAQPYSPDASHVWSALSFGTTLSDKSSLFSSLLCDDRITGIAAKLVGSKLRGNTAELQVLVDGVTTLRSCTSTSGNDVIVPWNLRPSGALAPAVIETGVNAYPSGVAPNQSLYDYGVAESHWIVAIPDAQTSPANAEIDQTQIDDIVLQITHVGQAVGSATASFNPSCPSTN
jgi:hypothetical protein